jgi:hypothetical protein
VVIDTSPEKEVEELISDGINRVRERLKTFFLSCGMDSRSAYVSVALCQRNHVQHELIASQDNDCGMASVQKQEIIKRKLFLIYSLTKTILATLVLRLVERSEIGLDRTINHWFADVPAASKITNFALKTSPF